MGVYRRALAAAAAAGGLAVAFAAAPHAAGVGDAPRILDARFLSSPVAGRTAVLEVRADSADRALSGIVVAFADGLFGESACQIDSSGKPPGAPFGAGDKVRFNVEHIFSKAGAQTIAVRIDDGGCAGGGGSVLQPYTVTPTEPGAPLGPTTLLPGTPIVTLPQAPGTTPVAPTVPSIPGLPSLPLPPSTPGVPIVIPGTTTTAVIVPTVPVTVPTLPVTVPTLPVTVPGITITVPTVLPLPLKRAAGARRDTVVRPAAAVKPCKGSGIAPATKKTIALARRATLCLINRERTRRGLRALHTDHRLSLAATAYSKLMVKRGFFAHVSPSGLKVVDRVRKQRYLPRFGRWRIGENIGMGERVLGTPRALVRAWMASTGHRANILDKGFHQIGLGIAPGTPGKASDRGATYTTDFGAVA